MTATAKTRIRNAVGREGKTLQEIAAITGLTPKQVERAVTQLCLSGRLRREGEGLYWKARL